MRVRHLLPVALVFAVAATALAADKHEPVTSVALAKSWDAAVDEAKALNVPIVVHSHGFYCGPCWGMHQSVMCNKKYIDFAKDNTVEVIALQRLDEGIEKKDKKAETYEAKVNGKTVEYLCEFPGLTVAEMLALNGSKASSYNDTGGIPYTCLVNPHTLEKITHWSGGGASAGTIMDAVTEAKKALVKEHGKGIARKDLKTLSDAEEVAAAKLEKADFSAAIDALGKVAPKAEKWPETLKTRLEAAKTKVVEEATKALDAIEAAKAEDPAKAKKDLAALAPKLRGTGLEQRAKDLSATL
jgi:hypothetical protein